MTTVEPSKPKHALQDLIDQLTEDMLNEDSNTEIYADMVTQMDTLYKLKEVDQKITSHKRVSADTWAIIGANLLGIVMIVGHERAAVLTSQAMKFVTKIVK